MISLEQALGILLIAYALGGILSYFVYNRAIDSKIKEILQNPVVKAGMSIIGKQGGQVRHDNAVMDRVAEQIFSSPQIKVLKTVGKQLGIDVDQMIEDQGPSEVLEQLMAGAQMLNIDIGKLLSGGLNTEGAQQSSGDNPYLK